MVNRQKNIENYIVDFFIANSRIIIELDGLQHGMPENRKDDEKRDSDLQHLRITVLRNTNLDIRNNFIALCEDILNHLGLRANELNNGDKR